MAKQDKKQKLELATLDANNIAELDGFKLKAEKAVKDYPFVKITDSKTYEKAKKHRTGLRSTRTEFQGQDKLIGSFLSRFRKSTKSITESLVLVVSPKEDKQQDEIDKWESHLEAKRNEKELAEQNRVKQINDKIDLLKTLLNDHLDLMVFDNIEETSNLMKDEISSVKDFDFEEFDVLFDEVVSNSDKAFIEKEQSLRRQENERLEQLKSDQQAKINSIFREASKIIDGANEFIDGHSFENTLNKMFDIDFDFGEFQDEFEETKKDLFYKASNKTQLLKLEHDRKKENEIQENKNRIINVREGLLDQVFQMDVDNYQKTVDSITKALNQKNPFPGLQDEFEKMISVVQKNFDSKMEMINQMIEQKKRDEELEEKRMEKVMAERTEILKNLGLVIGTDGKTFVGYGLNYDVSVIYEADDMDFIIQEINDWKNQIEEIAQRTESRGKQLEEIGFTFHDQKTENFWDSLLVDVEIWESLVEGLSNEDWNDYFNDISKRVDEAKEKNKAFKERQLLLKDDKSKMIEIVSELPNQFYDRFYEIKNEESLVLFDEIRDQLRLFVKTKIETINKF